MCGTVIWINVHLTSTMRLFLIDYNLSDVTRAIIKACGPDDTCHVALADCPPGESGISDITSIGNSLERRVHRALACISDTHMMHSTRSTTTLIDDIGFFYPDIVHINNVHMDFFNLPFLANALIKMQIPTVITLSPDFPVFENLPAIAKRRNYNRRMFNAMFDMWDLLFAVAPSEMVAKHASESLFDTTPVYIIEQTDIDSMSNKYSTLFHNI